MFACTPLILTYFFSDYLPSLASLAVHFCGSGLKRCSLQPSTVCSVSLSSILRLINVLSLSVLGHLTEISSINLLYADDTQIFISFSPITLSSSITRLMPPIKFQKGCSLTSFASSMAKPNYICLATGNVWLWNPSALYKIENFLYFNSPCTSKLLLECLLLKQMIHRAYDSIL